MIINFTRAGQIWHADCPKGHSAIMLRVAEDSAKKRDLMKCSKCDKHGFLPYGSMGIVECSESD